MDKTLATISEDKMQVERQLEEKQVWKTGLSHDLPRRRRRRRR